MRKLFSQMTPEEQAEELKCWAEIEEACVCPHCGCCVLAGPPCCEAQAKEHQDARLREQGLHPEQVAERRKAKRERRLARRAARRGVTGSSPSSDP